MDIISDNKIETYVRAWDRLIGKIPTEVLEYTFIDARITKHKAGEKGALTAMDVLTQWNLDGRYVHTFLPVSQHGLPKLYKNGESYWPQKKCGKGIWATGIPIRDEGYTEEELNAIRPLVKEWMKFVDSWKPKEKSIEEQREELKAMMTGKKDFFKESNTDTESITITEDLPF